MLPLKEARWASKGAGKALEGAGRASEAAGRVSKAARQAPESAGGALWAKKDLRLEAHLGKYEA